MQIRGSVLVVGGVLLAAGWLLVGAAPQVAVHSAGPFMAVERTLGTAIKPQNIINIDSEQLASGGYVEVPAAGWLTLLTVPPDRWFVMTNLQCVSGNSFHLEEVSGAASIVKRGWHFLLNSGIGGNLQIEGLSSPIGLAFAPGSQVVLRNDSNSLPYSIAFTLTGYMASP